LACIEIEQFLIALQSSKIRIADDALRKGLLRHLRTSPVTVRTKMIVNSHWHLANLMIDGKGVSERGDI